MNEIDIPILKKAYDLYKTFHEYRKVVPKADRFTIYERSEHFILDTIELLIDCKLRNYPFSLFHTKIAKSAEGGPLL